MKLCQDRVAIITGGGRGIGRSYALMLAAHGASVVVNDLGASRSGEGTDLSPAQSVVDEIVSSGGRAVVNTSDISDWKGAESLIESARTHFGRLDVLINNAGILRDRMLFNLTESDWDSVIQVHLKGTFATAHHASRFWRNEAKAGRPVDARIINTTSVSGLFGNVGQSNYSAAKAGVAAFTIVAARELQRLGVTVNAISPRAQTRMNEDLRALTEDESKRREPEWIAALVTWLSSPQSRDVTGRIFEASGHGYSVAEGWTHGPTTEAKRDPLAVGPGLREMLAQARANAGIEPGTWMNP